MADKNDRTRPDIGDALGLIETRGLVGMIEAADAMVKAANVVFVGWQFMGAGLVTAIVRGDVASVKVVPGGAGQRRGLGSLGGCGGGARGRVMCRARDCSPRSLRARRFPDMRIRS